MQTLAQLCLDVLNSDLVRLSVCAGALAKRRLTASCACVRLTVELGLQEDASLFENSELLHVYKGTYTAEYEVVHSRQGWKLISSSITL